MGPVKTTQTKKQIYSCDVSIYLSSLPLKQKYIFVWNSKVLDSGSCEIATWFSENMDQVVDPT